MIRAAKPNAATLRSGERGASLAIEHPASAVEKLRVRDMHKYKTWPLQTPCAARPPTAPGKRTAPAASRADGCLATPRTTCLGLATLPLLACHPRPNSTPLAKTAVGSPTATALLSPSPVPAGRTRPEVPSRQKG